MEQALSHLAGKQSPSSNTQKAMRLDSTQLPQPLLLNSLGEQAGFDLPPVDGSLLGLIV